MGEVRLESGWRTVIGGVTADKGSQEGRTYRATVSFDREAMRCGGGAVEAYIPIGEASPEQRKARWFSIRDAYEAIPDEDSAGSRCMWSS